MSYGEKCELIADQLLKAMEGDKVPWRKPWNTLLPQSVHGHGYKGYNLLICGLAPFSDPRWITFQEAQRRNGNVKKGEKSTRIYFWEFFDSKKTGADGDPQTRKIPFCKMIPVFNVEQCEGLELKPMGEARHDCNPIENAEKFLAALPWTCEVKYNAGRAYWAFADPHNVNMPKPETFKSMHHYYATLIHELAHASGFSSRLDRKTLTPTSFGSDVYSEEELVAEFAATFVCAELGIDNTDLTVNAVAYLQGWAEKIKADKAVVMRATQAAKKAAAYLLQNYIVKEDEVEVELELELVA